MTISKAVRMYSNGIALSCLVGLLLSLYALYVEIKAEANDNYEAMCDINEYISCSKVFTSKYGRGFGIIGDILGEDSILNQPNSLGGIVFYALVAGYIDSARASSIQVTLSIISTAMSVYLAYILYFILEDMCIVCISTYVVNLINLMLSLKRNRLFAHLNDNKRK